MFSCILAQLLTLRGSSVEEMVCKGQQIERLVVLPSDTQVTAEQVSSALCYTKDSTALVASFIAHLNLTPLISMVRVSVWGRGMCVCVCVCLD